ncbi:hypothetical protein chiPu_0002893 [Chiloscyllium punctatum]|uniref:Uncharacterized protein n=1 Tax=Chiloscyllium punctatum TaxID=137246 RepID=A0A401S284_CHIPU|nr:hypothetical protein [Chiloscyllium punctatum]
MASFTDVMTTSGTDTERTMFLVILAICFYAVNAAPSFGSGGDRTFPHDITSQSELTRLYNTPVVQAERMTRPLDYFGWLGFRHSGVRVTTDDGHQWLIHKGGGYGRTSQTVVTDADHMSDRWTVREERPVHGRTVEDFVRAGGENYNVLTDNCHDASGRMMRE